MRKLRRAKRWRGGGDAVVAEVAEAVAVAEAAGVAEGVAADRLRLLNLRGRYSGQPREWIVEPGSTTSRALFICAVGNDG
jgi:hypothetical protein